MTALRMDGRDELIVARRFMTGPDRSKDNFRPSNGEVEAFEFLRFIILAIEKRPGELETESVSLHTEVSSLRGISIGSEAGIFGDAGGVRDCVNSITYGELCTN